ncbi:MAG: response regulator [Candidatus Saccharimonadales bacterium]
MAKILLVEDDNNLREIYEARLAAEGYDIAAAQDGEEALVLAKKEHPDLIISDVMMPRISGFEMLDILRNTDELKHTKIIMLTALGQAEDQTRADNLGADRYLVKSQVTLEDIVKSAQELLSTVDASTSPAVAPTTSEPTTALATPVTPAEPDVTPSPASAVISEPATPSEPALAPATDNTSVAPSAEPPLDIVTPSGAEPVDTTPIDVTTTAPTGPQEAETPTIVSPVTEDALPTASTPEPVIAEPAPVVEAPAPEPPTETPVVEPTMPDVISAQAVAGETVVEAPVVEADQAESSVTNSEPQSLEAEEAAIQAQIASFENAAPVSSPVITPTVGSTNPEPVTDDAMQPVTTPELETADDKAAAETEAADDTVMANAVDQLVSSVSSPVVDTQKTPVMPVEPATAPTTETVSTTPTNDQVPIAHKKIIQPIGTTDARPSLDELLAKEDAKISDEQPVIPVVDGTAVSPSSVSPSPSVAPTTPSSFDPNSISL